MATAAVGLEVPLRGAAAGLYWRIWQLVFPGQPAYADGGARYEAMGGSFIDRHERYARRRLAAPRRRLAALAIGCDGEHWGRPVACKYAADADNGKA